MSRACNIPFVFWGGEPIRIRAQTKSFNERDLVALRHWAEFLSDPSKASASYIDYLLLGRTWINIPGRLPGMRLLIRPFCESRSDARPLWYFLGCVLDSDRELHGSIIQRLSTISRQDIGTANDCIVLHLPHVEPANENPACLRGLILRGEYETTLQAMGAAFAVAPEEELARTVIASNPPDTHSDFTALLLCDDFCFRNILLSARSHSVEPKHEPTLPPSAPVPKTSRQIFRFMPLVKLCGFVSFVGFILWSSSSIGKCRKDKDRLLYENKSLKTKIHDDYTTIVSLNDEKRNLETKLDMQKRASEKGEEPVKSKGAPKSQDDVDRPQF